MIRHRPRFSPNRPHQKWMQPSTRASDSKRLLSISEIPTTGKPVSISPQSVLSNPRALAPIFGVHKDSGPFQGLSILSLFAISSTATLKLFLNTSNLTSLSFNFTGPSISFSLFTHSELALSYPLYLFSNSSRTY